MVRMTLVIFADWGEIVNAEPSWAFVSFRLHEILRSA